MDTFQVIGGIMVTVFSAVGVGSLILALINRWWKKTDEAEVMHQTNTGKEIDADINAFNAISQRLLTVEKRLDDVVSDLMAQKVENAKLEAENLRLAKENERQETEIQRQRTRLHDLAGNIQNKDTQILELRTALNQRERELEALRNELHHTTLAVNALQRQLEGMKGS